MRTEPLPKYQYRLHTWGGFYNAEFKIIHGLEEGDYYFNTFEAREKFIDERRAISDELNATQLVLSTWEGFACNVNTVLHRVSEYLGERVYTTDVIANVEYTLEDAKHRLEHKWYPGFNDYPFGETFDYTDKRFKVLQEWVTGAFTTKLNF
jgi:hypothetical protein